MRKALLSHHVQHLNAQALPGICYTERSGLLDF